MSGKEKHTPELTAFEAELASLRPHAGGLETARLDVGRLMFLAGQESASRRPRRWTALAWPTAFSVMTGVAAVLLVLLASRPRPEVLERIVRVEVPARTVSAEPVTTPQSVPSPRSDEHLPVAETAVASAAEGGHVHRLLASLFFNSNQTMGIISPDRHQLSYQELRDHIVEHGIDNWPIQTPVRPHRSANKPMTRQELMEALLNENG